MDCTAVVQVFAFEGAEVRTVLVGGEPWWVASDVCAVLGYSRVADALRIPDEDDLGTHFVRGDDGKDRPAQIVSEPGLYSLILRSKREEAKRFKRWVTHEVIPQIRKTGSYQASTAAKEITAAAGALPYREQAETLVILRPMLPAPYATATAKIIMARAMGERPELGPAETPLYAATFLAEKGHKPTTVSKFQSGFGQRVSNRYLKVHGRRPEKIPGPAGSRIDRVVVYSEDDRPLLEQVYAEIADLITVFETGGQTAISG